jgi:hypothetical protein
MGASTRTHNDSQDRIGSLQQCMLFRFAPTQLKKEAAQEKLFKHGDCANKSK